MHALLHPPSTASRVHPCRTSPAGQTGGNQALLAVNVSAIAREIYSELQLYRLLASDTATADWDGCHASLDLRSTRVRARTFDGLNLVAVAPGG